MIVQKHSTIYQGIRIESKEALLYNVVFCVRRFYIVLINFYFAPAFPFSDYESHAYLLKVLTFLIL